MSARPTYIDLAISIRQPYAELILRRLKVLEFRSQPFTGAGWFWLYAPKTMADDAEAWGQLEPGAADRLDLTRGKIVGAVRIDGCEWHEGRECFAYTLADPLALTTPVTPNAPGQPRFWRPMLDRDLMRAMHRNMRPRP